MATNSREKQREYDAGRAGARTRNWTAVMYPEDLPENWVELFSGLRVRWVQSPLHNGDFLPNGEPKKPHYHVLVMFDSVKTLEQFKAVLKGLFGESETGSIIGVAEPQEVRSRGGLVRYMAHLDNPDKVQYDVHEIKGHNGADVAEILQYSATETREMMIAMEEYIEQNRITEIRAFSAAIREVYPEWYNILTSRNTVYFKAFISSFRHSLRESDTQPSR